MADVLPTLAQWSATTNSNAPAGTVAVGTGLDDSLRELQGVVVRGLSHKGSDIASASTTDLGAVEGSHHDITGSTTITSFGTVRAGIAKVLKFEGAITLTHHATALILPGAANITTADGDVATFVSEGSGNWRCTNYQAASFAPSLTNFFTTGDVKLTIKTVADAGWVLMNDGTLGNAASGATTRANADTSALYVLLWNNTANADCAVSTGRGANAAADYAANKTIALPKALGRALAGYGSGSGLTARAMGAIVGVETHVLTTAEMPAHTHDILASQSLTGAGAGADINSTGITDTTESTGGGGAHQNMQPSLFLSVMIKL